MKMVKVLFVGVGSIAMRHIKNLYEVFKEQKKVFVIDVFRKKNNAQMNSEILEYIDEVYLDFDKIPNDYDIVFITNPTEYHMNTLEQFHMKGKHFFIEKPICTVQQIEHIRLEYLKDNRVYYVAGPLRYTKVLKYVKSYIDVGKVYAVRAICSSYLPEWRPGIDYRATYSAHRDLGGGVAIDLIHEWDYLTYLFGKPESVYSIIKKVSDLEIDSDDIAIYIGEYKDKLVEVHLDYFGRKAIRKLELYMKDDTVECDLIKSTITFLKTGQVIEFGQERDDFQKEEIRYFLDLVSNEKYGVKNIVQAIELIRLIGGN